MTPEKLREAAEEVFKKESVVLYTGTLGTRQPAITKEVFIHAILEFHRQQSEKRVDVMREALERITSIAPTTGGAHQMQGIARETLNQINE